MYNNERRIKDAVNLSHSPMSLMYHGDVYHGDGEFDTRV